MGTHTFPHNTRTHRTLNLWNKFTQNTQETNNKCWQYNEIDTAEDTSFTTQNGKQKVIQQPTKKVTKKNIAELIHQDEETE